MTMAARARSEGQGGELVEHVDGGGRRLTESFDGGELGVPAALAVDDQDRPGMARLDGHGADLHGVDEAEAGIAEVVVDALGPESQSEVHRTGHAGFEVVLAHRGRDQKVHLGRGDSGQLEGPHTGLGRRLVEGDLLGPPAALDDAGHRFEESRSDAATVVGLGQLLVDPGRSDDLGSLRVTHAPDGRSHEFDTGAHRHRLRRVEDPGGPSRSRRDGNGPTRRFSHVPGPQGSLRSARIGPDDLVGKVPGSGCRRVLRLAESGHRSTPKGRSERGCTVQTVRAANVRVMASAGAPVITAAAARPEARSVRPGNAPAATLAAADIVVPPVRRECR